MLVLVLPLLVLLLVLGLLSFMYSCGCLATGSQGRRLAAPCFGRQPLPPGLHCCCWSGSMQTSGACARTRVIVLGQQHPHLSFSFSYFHCPPTGTGCDCCCQSGRRRLHGRVRFARTFAWVDSSFTTHLLLLPLSCLLFHLLLCLSHHSCYSYSSPYLLLFALLATLAYLLLLISHSLCFSVFSLYSLPLPSLSLYIFTTYHFCVSPTLPSLPLPSL